MIKSSLILGLLLCLRSSWGANLMVTDFDPNRLERRQINFTSSEETSSNYIPGDYSERYFNQLIDHEDRDKLFSQRYFVNGDLYKPGGAAFLYISGEQAASNKSIARGLITELAREHNGIIYNLEHRYYGLSQPFKTHSTKNLKYLSSHYGLLDLQRFAKKVINPITNMIDENWYVIGGSYAGTLSAWARQQFPDIFKGSLASSAPVLAKEDFYEYDESIFETLGTKCASKLEKVVDLLDESYTKNRTLFLGTKRALGCLELKDDIQFLYTVYDAVSGIVQYNSPRSNPSVASMCQGLESASDSKAILISLIKTLNLYFKNTNSNCFKFSNHQDILNKELDEQAMMRQWNYQCCTEFGFWQTASKSNSMRSKLLTVDWFNSFFCSSEFYGQDIGPPKPHEVNRNHDGINIDVSKTIFTNGDMDPWSKLSLSSQQSHPNRPVYIIHGGSHVTDLGPATLKDSSSLSETRSEIFKTFRHWIQSS